MVRLQALPLKRRLADGGALEVAQASGAPPTRAAETDGKEVLLTSNAWFDSTAAYWVLLSKERHDHKEARTAARAAENHGLEQAHEKVRKTFVLEDREDA